MAKTLNGVVSSDKGDKTIVVTVATRKTHPLYKKQYTFSKKFMAHDETNQAKVGDRVVIAETKPMSARKRFILETVLERAPIRHTEAEASETLIVSAQPPVKEQKKVSKKQTAITPEAKS